MLNYEELDRQVDDILATFSREDIENWIAFDAQREMLDQLQAGQTVITYHSIPVTKLVDARDSFLIEFLTEEVYTLAA